MRVKKDFELSRLEFKGESYYVRGTAYVDDSKEGMELEIDTCLRMPECEVPAGMEALITECLDRDDYGWEVCD